MSRNDKHLAIKLRRQGKSYRAITKELGIPKSTLSEWFSGIAWSGEIRDELARRAIYISRKRLRLVNKERAKMWERWREAAREEARKDFPTLAKNPLFVAGVMLYWGEGDGKPRNPVRISNTDPRMIRLYMRFVTSVLHIPLETARVTLVLYPDLSEVDSKKVWTDATGIQPFQFYKTQFIQGRHPTKRLSYGICMVTCGNKQLKEKILVWIDLLHKKLLQ